jgi:hypothetical protein
MPDTYTIAAAARLCHCDRRTLQRAIRRGTLHLDANHCLSREDLLLAGYLVTDTPLAAPQVPPQDIPLVTPQVTPLATPLLSLLERLTIALEGIWHELQRLQPAAPSPQTMPQATPQAAPLVPPPHQQPSRQRPAAPPPPGAATPGRTRRTGRPPGPLRQQILALLQAHPEGLRAEELRVYLQTPRPIGDTLQGMLKGGVITVQGRGTERRYVATAPSQHDDT